MDATQSFRANQRLHVKYMLKFKCTQKIRIDIQNVSKQILKIAWIRTIEYRSLLEP